MRVALGGERLTMSQNAADQRKSHAAPCPHVGAGMPKIVDATIAPIFTFFLDDQIKNAVMSVADYYGVGGSN